MDIQSGIKLQVKQRALFRMYDEGRPTIVGFGGARGGAKSHAGRTIMVLRRWMYKDTPGFIIRRTLDDLRDNHIKPLFREMPHLAEHYNKMEKVLNFTNGSYLRFISSDNHDDIFKLVGKEAADIFVDQSEQFTQEQLEFLTTINRCTSNNKITSKMLLTFNPGDVGHLYHKRIFIDREFEGNELPEDYSFLQAYGWDNAAWATKALEVEGISWSNYYSWTNDQRFEFFVTKTDYGRKLNRLPESQRRARLLGDWDVFEGQFFDNFRRDLHKVKAEARDWPPREWNILGSIDYGGISVMEILTRDYEGNIICFAECYTKQMDPVERFTRMANVLLDRGLFAIDMLGDSNMSIDLKNYTGYDKTPEEIANEVFKGVMGADKAPRLYVLGRNDKMTNEKKGYRAVCNEAVRDFLSWEKNEKGELTRRPRLYITEDCPMLLKTLPTLIHNDKHDGLDFDDQKGDDNPYDAMKYAFMDLTQPRERKKKEAIPSRTIQDMQSEPYLEEMFERNLQEVMNPRINSDAL